VSGGGTTRLDGRALLACLLLAAAVLAVYWQIHAHEFVNYDDLEYIVENPHVSGGLSVENIAWAFRGVHSANWHPLTWISHMLDYELFGSDPAGHHMVGVFIHALNALFLFVTLRAMTGAFWRCLVVAALFALHPMRVESVAWAAERKDLLCGLFWILALLAYTFYAARPSIGRYLPVAAAFILGLLSKPMIVTLPALLLLLDYWPLRRSLPLRRLLLEKLPLLVLSALAGLITMTSQKSAGAFYAIPFGPRLANAALAYVGYIWKTILPVKLAIFYPHPVDLHEPGDLGWIWMAAGAAILLAAATLVVWLRRARYPWLLSGWLWYIGTLVPVLGIIQVGRQAMADRYSYLPLVGLYIAAVWTAAELAARRPVCGTVLRTAAPILLALLALISWTQAGHWRTSETLYVHALTVTRSNALAHYNLGTALLARGETEKARTHFEQAASIIPRFADAHANLAVCHFRLNDAVRAGEQLDRALRIEPDHVEAHYNYGRILLAMRELRPAAARFERALDLDPEHVESLTNLGVTLAMMGEPGQAELRFKEAIRLEPGHVSALMNLGRLLERRGELRAAEEFYRRAREQR
jgi:Tfp pilus assembly protein PilF